MIGDWLKMIPGQMNVPCSHCALSLLHKVKCIYVYCKSSFVSDRNKATKFVFYADIYSKIIHLTRTKTTVAGLNPNLNPFIQVNHAKIEPVERQKLCHAMFKR